MVFLITNISFYGQKIPSRNVHLDQGFKVPSRNTCLAAMDLAVSETKELAQKNGLVFDGKSIVKTMGFAQWTPTITENLEHVTPPNVRYVCCFSLASPHEQ